MLNPISPLIKSVVVVLGFVFQLFVVTVISSGVNGSLAASASNSATSLLLIGSVLTLTEAALILATATSCCFVLIFSTNSGFAFSSFFLVAIFCLTISTLSGPRISLAINLASVNKSSF